MSDPIRGSRSQLGGRFTLESELGSGGMATVYLGRDQVLDRPVAVKVLKHGFDEDIAERFQREGRTAARLSHLNSSKSSTPERRSSMAGTLRTSSWSTYLAAT